MAARRARQRLQLLLPHPLSTCAAPEHTDEEPQVTLNVGVIGVGMIGRKPVARPAQMILPLA